MPSSKKKISKTPSKLSNNSDSHQNNNSSSSSSSSSPLFNSNPNLEEEFSPSLNEAAAKFPSFISSTAFVGRVSNVAVAVSERGCKIWLSESAMLSSSIKPRSLVSVSLASSDKNFTGFPLSELSDECAKNFSFDLAENLADEAGNFFALATVYPSDKCNKEEFLDDTVCEFMLEVLKNGVLLSSNLSHTLGCPASGRTVFVYPVNCQPLTEYGNGKPCGLGVGSLSLDSCKELYLSLVSMKGKLEMESAKPSRLDLLKEVTNGEVENSKISSPKTPPSSESKVSSPFPSQSCTSNYKISASTTKHSTHSSLDIHDVKEFLGDNSSRKLLEICIAACLSSRTLLSGNFVIVPLLSRLCIFQVVDSKRSTPNSEIWNNKNPDFHARVPDIGKDVANAFSVNLGAKIHFLLPGDPMVVPSETKSLALPGLGNGFIKDRMGVKFSKLGGLSKEYSILKDIIVSSAVKARVAKFGLRSTKGVLLHGPSGTGKTTLAQLCANDAGVNLFSVNGPEIISQYHGESEQALHEIFEKASQAAPAVLCVDIPCSTGKKMNIAILLKVFIDELDAIAPARKDGGDGLSQRMVATLLTLMDGISSTDGIVIIAATNQPDSIDPALRRCGRLERVIEIGVPSPVQRREILHVILSEMRHSLLDKDIQQLAMVTHGYVGADLAALCNEAALVRRRQYIKLTLDSDFKLSTFALDSVSQTSSPSCDARLGGDMDASQSLEYSVQSNLEAAFSCTLETQNSSDIMDGIGVTGTGVRNDILRITSEDFEKARVKIRPSAMREVNLEVPKVSWEDVGGQEEVKQLLKEAVEWPLKFKDAFTRIGTRPPRGILLFGPPGCSKTLLARAVASEAGLNFLAVKGPELFSKWVGESEKAVRSLFAKARANEPSIIFFDEIDGLAVIRGKESDGVSVGDRVMSQLLVELDGLKQRGDVTVIAATNRPDKIDKALLRPGEVRYRDLWKHKFTRGGKQVGWANGLWLGQN
ncbi:hypothetical protein RD792_017753 [Penstemon davidsonii]|uniref:AAA+ ATPase domain-containing protein n=1 Tax=Penstemon davidsonii TaxID=160366 RepID=A0ABR0DX07_9LAMI|nr:hypothetical protein RD792_017753 [Penstemon davidsonii]